MNAPATNTAEPKSMAISTVSAKPGLAQKLVLQALGRMTAGHLRLELPDGSVQEIGRSGAPIAASIKIRSSDFFQKVMLYGDVGFGESYVDGDWDTPSIERVISWAIHNIDNSPAMSGSKTKATVLNLLKFGNRVKHLLRPNTKDTARQNISEHYDLGNDFYQLWLDPTMTYSSAIFSSPQQSLEDAQIAKYDALCQKLEIRPGDRVLEIGSGWGGFSSHAVRNYGCHVTTVTISQRQYDYARERFQREGIADKVDVRLQDYRDITGKFDKVASIEMMEAIGDKFLETYFRKIHEVLTPDGMAALQYITCPDSRHGELKKGVDWIQKHIFPGSLLLSIGRVNQSINRTGDLYLHGLQDIGLSYARTLREWFETFNARQSEVRALGFDERFQRKWNYYLQYCESAFAMRNISVVQAVYTRPNNPRLR